MQLRKSRFFFLARGVQLDNGVHPPCTYTTSIMFLPSMQGKFYLANEINTLLVRLVALINTLTPKGPRTFLDRDALQTNISIALQKKKCEYCFIYTSNYRILHVIHIIECRINSILTA